MKKVLVLLVVASLSFWGCSENSSITEPNDVQSNQSFLKINNSDVSELSIEAKSALGSDGVNTLNKSFLPIEVIQTISAEGGEIRFLLADNQVYATGKLEIAKKSFSVDTPVTIAMVSTEAALDFFPNVDFKKSAELTVGFIGVDVKVGDDVDFVYMDGDEEVSVKNKKIIVGNGWVVVVKARLDHFSRFGFTK